MENPWEDMTYNDGLAMDKRKDTRPSVVVKRTILWNMIKRFLPRDLSQPILDLGGGTGIGAIQIANQGYPVVLTDISPGLLECAETKIKSAGLTELVTIRDADICELTAFDDSSFQLVLALGDPLSYCAEPEFALKQIRRVTAKDGIFIGDVENRYCSVRSPRRASNWQEAKMILLEGKGYWPGTKDSPRIHQFTPMEIRKLLEASGWTVQEMYPSDLMMNFLMDKIFNEVCSAPAGIEEVVSVEEEVRKDDSILGAGEEIQFIVSS